MAGPDVAEDMRPITRNAAPTWFQLVRHTHVTVWLVRDILRLGTSQETLPRVDPFEKVGELLRRGVNHAATLDQEPDVGPVLSAGGDKLHGEDMLRRRDMHRQAEPCRAAAWPIPAWVEPIRWRCCSAGSQEDVVRCKHSRFFDHSFMADNCVDIGCESVSAVLEGHGGAADQVDARFDVPHLQSLV